MIGRFLHWWKFIKQEYGDEIFSLCVGLPLVILLWCGIALVLTSITCGLLGIMK